ncbi:MAG: DsbA family protein [Pseudomonadota bacterium]
MKFPITRRGVLGGLAATTAVGPQAFAQDASRFTGDIVMGNLDAAVTVYEYASFTCPHCAAFHINTWPQVKEAYVDTGKIKFILREVYFDQYGLWASMTARCGGERGFYPMVDRFLATQNAWTRAPDIGHAIQQIGKRAGLSTNQLTECLSDRAFAETLISNYQANAGEHEVRSTPTFIINGESHAGNMGFEDFAKLIDEALEA